MNEKGVAAGKLRLFVTATADLRVRGAAAPRNSDSPTSSASTQKGPSPPKTESGDQVVKRPPSDEQGGGGNGRAWQTLLSKS